MDIETLKSILTIAVWGALFLLMMRYGCGAHALGRHGRHDTPAQPDARDPVCGMSVRPGGASAAVVHQGRTYYFCSPTCRDTFEGNPTQYVPVDAARN